MTSRVFTLVHFNMAIAKYPLDHPGMATFAAQLEIVNQAAQASPGFVWTAENGEAGDAVAVFGTPLVLANISIWTSLDALRRFTYGGLHGTVLSRRRDWFEIPEGPSYVLWWAPAGHRPAWAEAKDRMQQLRDSGSTPRAFTFAKAFGPDGATLS